MPMIPLFWQFLQEALDLVTDKTQPWLEPLRSSLAIARSFDTTVFVGVADMMALEQLLPQDVTYASLRADAKKKAQDATMARVQAAEAARAASFVEAVKAQVSASNAIPPDAAAPPAPEPGPVKLVQ